MQNSLTGCDYLPLACCIDRGRVTHKSMSMRNVRKKKKDGEMYSSRCIVRKNTHFAELSKDFVLNLTKEEVKKEGEK